MSPHLVMGVTQLQISLTHWRLTAGESSACSAIGMAVPGPSTDKSDRLRMISRMAPTGEAGTSIRRRSTSQRAEEAKVTHQAGEHDRLTGREAYPVVSCLQIDAKLPEQLWHPGSPEYEPHAPAPSRLIPSCERRAATAMPKPI